MVVITEKFVTECLLIVQTFFESICGKCSAGKLYMGGWIKLPKKKKREKILFTYECSVSTQKKTFVRDLHDADVRYYLDCWLGVTKIQAYWSGAIVTTISSIIY